MLPVADLFVHVQILLARAVDTGMLCIPPRPGPRPRCSDIQVLTVALVRHVLGRRSEAGWLRELRANWPHLVPGLVSQSRFNRRVRWLWGAFEQLRAHLATQVPEDPWQQIDTSALPVRHPSRVRGPDSWTGPNGLHARFGRDGAHAEWFYGFRLAVRTDLDSRLVRGWGIVPAAVNERTVADGLLDGRPLPFGLLLDRGFTSRAWAASWAEHGVRVVVAHGRAQRRELPASVRRPVAALRNRVETSLGEITDQLELARHGAHTFWGLLTRTAATLCAHTLRLTQLRDQQLA